MKTASGNTAVQIVRDVNRKTVVDQHLGTARDEFELAALLQRAENIIQGDQLAFDFSTAEPSTHGLSVHSISARLLRDVLEKAWNTLGFDTVCPCSAPFAQVVMARVVHPSSKSKTPAVLERLGWPTMHRNTVNNAVKRGLECDFRDQLATACFQFSMDRGTAAWVLYDVTTLYFETDKEDELRKVGYSKERRVDPQIVVGLLVDRQGLPLEISCFEGNKAETNTMIPVLSTFRERHKLENIIVVADAGMISAHNCQKLEKHGFQFIVGARMSKAPYGIELVVNETGDGVKDGRIIEDTKVLGSKAQGQTTYRMVCQYSKKRFHRDKQSLAKQQERAQGIVDGTRRQKQTRFVTHKAGSAVFNNKDYDKALRLAGWKGYVTNIKTDDFTGAEIISKYHDLYEVERSFRMSKSDLQARPMYVKEKDSIDAHLTVVFAALAISRYLQDKTGMSRQKIIDTLEPLRDVTINTPQGKLTIPTQISHDAETILTEMSY